MKQNEGAIINWMANSKGQQLAIEYKANATLGISVTKDGKVIDQTRATIILKKD